MRHKFTWFLLLALIVCALGVITSQHLARKLYSELEKNRNSPVNWKSSSANCNSNKAPGRRIR